jgi:hypothetical protein
MRLVWCLFSGAPEADPFIRVFVNRLSQGAGVAYARSELSKICERVAALYRLWQNSQQQQQYVPNVNPLMHRHLLVQLTEIIH